MRLAQLQENLRQELRARITRGEFSGLKLALVTGFKQAHISNFLNSKRQLSIEGFDRLLSASGLSILDLLDPAEINQRASIVPRAESGFENVLLVSGRTAATEPVITERQVEDILKFKKSFLTRLRPAVVGARSSWTRFVLIKVDEVDARSMYPRLMSSATVLIDRHHNALTPYRRGEANMYAVRRNGACTVKYVEQVGRNLVLRPHDQDHPVDVINVGPADKATDHIVGRVCYVSSET